MNLSILATMKVKVSKLYSVKFQQATKNAKQIPQVFILWSSKKFTRISISPKQMLMPLGKISYLHRCTKMRLEAWIHFQVHIMLKPKSGNKLIPKQDTLFCNMSCKIRNPKLLISKWSEKKVKLLITILI